MKRQIIQDIAVIHNDFTKCNNIGEMKAFLTELVNLYGEEAKFTPRSNAFNATVHFNREETDDEYFLRTGKRFVESVPVSMFDKDTEQTARRALASIRSVATESDAVIPLYLREKIVSVLSGVNDVNVAEANVGILAIRLAEELYDDKKVNVSKSSRNELHSIVNSLPIWD